MSKMGELSQALDELIACGEKLTTTAKAIREYFSVEEMPETPKAPETNQEPKPEVKYSFTDVRKAFSAKSHAGYTEQVKQLINRYGADKLSAIREEDYGAIMAELEAIT